MSRAMSELEFECEGECELENEWEGESESEEFFGNLTRLARRAAQSPALRRIALTAARSAVNGLNGVEGPLAAPRPDQPGGQARNTSDGPDPEFEAEFEGEFEYEGEGEGFASPPPTQTATLMAHLGHAAAQAESEDEAAAYLGAMVPLAARVAPQIAPSLRRAMPQLVRAMANIARTFRTSPTTRPLVQTLPAVTRNTAASLARQARAGRRVTPQTAVRTLARQTASVVGNPQRAVAAYEQSRALDRRYHATTPGARPARRQNRPSGPTGAINRPGNCGCSG